MPIRVALHHKTVYQYDRLVSLSPQIIRLRPAPHCRANAAHSTGRRTPGKARSSQNARKRRFDPPSSASKSSTNSPASKAACSPLA